MPAGKPPSHLVVLSDRTLEVHKLNADMTLNESSMNAPASGKGVSKMEFTFDKVFGGNVRQDEIFKEISQLVQSAIDGYNVCIFAYGQTGSGKTYTMEGRLCCFYYFLFHYIFNHINIALIISCLGGEAGSESEGMIPRAVRLIFQMCEALKEKGWVYKIEASFLEIYNEQIRDLLGPSGQVHEIRVINNEVTVTNLKVR